jgi:scyllo-inositol 2-dehydrogenase (NADP+)
MSENPRLRVAVIGLGWVSTNRHIPAMRAHGGFDIVGVIDRHPGAAEQVARKLGCKFHCGDDASAAQWFDEVDTVVVATPPFAHFQTISTSLAAGKHVLTEKPFTMTLTEGEQLLAAALNARRVLGIVHNFQFARSTRRLLKDLENGRLGPVRGLIARQYGNPGRRLPRWYEQIPLGLFYDESPHLLYLLRRLAPGPLRLLAADVVPSTIGKVTPALVQVQYECETEQRRVPVTLSLNFESPISEWHVAVLGEHAWGDIDVFRDIYVRLPNDGEHTSSTVLRTSLRATWDHWRQHLSRGPLHLAGRLRYGNDEVFARFHASATSGVPLEAISAADALDVLRMQHAILQSQRVLA